MVPSFEPIPETVEALDELDAPVDVDDLLERLAGLAGRAGDVVPSLVAMSIARSDSGLTFTLVATAEELATLDAVQYVEGGPCVAHGHDGLVREFESDDVLDEDRWQLFGETTAAQGVRSTLTLPVVMDGKVVGTVNLYAASPRAFAGRHDELAGLFGAMAAGAVSNADLPFATRAAARAAPERARELQQIEIAIGIVASQVGVDVDEAENRFLDAAVRGGVSASQLARQILEGNVVIDLGGG